MSGPTIAAVLESARHHGLDAVDARVLLRHAIGRSAAYLIAHPDVEITEAEHTRYAASADRRARGEPVAYIVGEREFYGRSFIVTPAVLIPRPETELLVEHALRLAPRAEPSQVLDLGTGTGCVALSIASERSHYKILALDQSLVALDVAKRNVERLGLRNVELAQSDWFSALGRARFDLIVSNPPYVAAGDRHLESGDLRFEPESALVGGADGLDCIRKIIEGATRHLADGGWLLLEHGYDQAARVRALLEKNAYSEVFSVRDLSGIERVTGARLTRAARADTIPDKLTQV